MKKYDSTAIKEALYNTFACRLGPDGWENLESEFWDELETAQQSVHPTNGGLALRACVSAHCGWVGKESACLTWKHAGDERLCPHCHDNTESIPLSAISG